MKIYGWANHVPVRKHSSATPDWLMAAVFLIHLMHLYADVPYELRSSSVSDHYSVEQREAAAQPEQMASHARSPHCDRWQEEGEGHCHSQLKLQPALTSEWQDDKLSLAQSVYASLTLSISVICFSPWCLFFSLSIWRVHRSVQHLLLQTLPIPNLSSLCAFSFFCFFPLQRQNL